MGVQVINGFVPDAFPARHQSQQQMMEWLDKLRRAVTCPMQTFETRFEDLWLWEIVRDSHSTQPIYSSDHPHEPADRYASPEDAVRSQCVLHQRFKWLDEAAWVDPEDTFIWLEPTIFKQRGVTADAIKKLICDVQNYPVNAISLPGVWEKKPVFDAINHWRFCGSCWVCPGKYAYDVFHVAKRITYLRARLTHRLCWDNSTWSYIELLNLLPMRWYPGNHDETQLTNYRVGL